MQIPLQEAQRRAMEYINQSHCGPAVLQVMWEAYGLDNPDALWAGTVFWGGIGGEQQASCGALSVGAIALGLRHRVATDDEEKAEAARKAASRDAAALVASFREKFGEITCWGLLGVDVTDEDAVKKAREAGAFERCDEQVMWVIAKLYEMEEKRLPERSKLKGQKSKPELKADS